jgi:glyoxylate/hydroxypyruvate reductase A
MSRPRARRAPPVVAVYYPDPREAERYARCVRAPRGAVRLRVCADAASAAAIAEDVEVLFAWKFPPALYARARSLRWLQAMGAGVDWALADVPARVTITRAPGVFGPWMAEYVAGWCLWVTQRMAAYRTAQAERRWLDTVWPERLGGKTLAVIGLGEIGREIARVARALGMEVVGVSRSGRAVRGVRRVWTMRDAARAIREAHFVVIVLPLTSSTRGAIGAPALAAMRPDAWLLNIGRGPVVDEAALQEALAARRIAGAVLDVFAREPPPADHPFWGMDNVVITPHVAGPSVPEEIAPVFNDNLARYLAGRPLRHVVDRQRGY